MIITQYQKSSLHQIMHANISDSDKIENLKEVLRPYNLADHLDNYYSPRALFDQFGNDNQFKDQLKPLKKYLKPSFLSSKHYYTVDDSGTIHAVTNTDVKNAEQRTIKLLQHSDD